MWKHLALAEILRLNPPRHYWETHAGSASYPLTESSTRLHGALRFLSAVDREPVLERCEYVALLRSMPRVYPGSAMIAMRTLHNRAHYLLCDTDRQSVQSLREVSDGLDCSVVERDGMCAIAEVVDTGSYKPAEVLVHIDPFDPEAKAFEDAPSAIDLVGRLACDGFRVVYWYGYESAADRGWPCSRIASVAPRVALWCGDVMLPSPFVFPERPGTWGCGILLANATDRESSRLRELGEAFERISDDDVLPGNHPDRLTFQEI